MNTYSNQPNMNLDEILTEVAARVDNGAPNFSNKKHLDVLVNVLKENRWPNSAIKFFVRNLWLVANKD